MLKWNKAVLAFIAVLMVVLVYSGIHIAKYFAGGAKNEKEIIAVREAYYDTKDNREEEVEAIIEENISPIESRDYLRQYQAILELNEDIVGWITIPDTTVDFPVVKCEDNEYYLGRNLLRRYSDRGSIFMDYRNEGDEDDQHIIIYGHNMYDGTMFGKLYKYREQAYYNKHTTIEYNAFGENAEWEIFSVYITDDDPIRITFSGESDFQGYIDKISSKSLYDTEIDVSVKDKLLTISTCVNDFNDARLVLHAKKMTD